MNQDIVAYHLRAYVWLQMAENVVLSNIGATGSMIPWSSGLASSNLLHSRVQVCMNTEQLKVNKNYIEKVEFLH